MMSNIGVHASHCCKWHGCKYGDPDCPVVSGEVKQEYLCEDCYRQIIKNIEEIKNFKKEKTQK